jgi:hypothetical protein
MVMKISSDILLLIYGLFLSKVYKNITIAFFVFLTLSVGIVSANSVAKSVYAQSNTLGHNGGGNDAGQDIE